MKTFAFKVDPLTGEEYLEVYLRGRQLINDPLLNKLSAFTQEERHALELEGLLRAHVSTVEEQVARTMEMYRRKSDDLERYIYLQALLDRSEVLFYRILREHLSEMVPVVYTPTVGQACQQLSHIMRRYRGIYLTPDNIGQVDRIFQSISRPHISLVVVTDGERILGLGDLGSDGMGIPVGKVNLYVAAGGLHPACCLPICLDVGTNNPRLLEDPLYLGHRRPRLEGDEYAAFVERFVLGVRRNFPDALLQWEDFAKHKAFGLLDRYRERLLSFNDDIQGTGATAVAVLLTATRLQGTELRSQRVAIVGMGQAGVGIARSLEAALCAEGCTPAEARAHIYALDQPGLLLDETPGLEAPQRPFARPRGEVAQWRLEQPGRVGLDDVVANAGITALVGVTAQPGLFGAPLLARLARNTARPVVLALSNPTSRCECTPLDVARATDGRGLFAAGSPFAPIEWSGRSLPTSQCNNLYVFPGVGLGALVARAPRVTDGMFLAASRTLAAMVTPAEAERGLLLPPLEEIREASARVATAVACAARDAGLGRVLSDEEYARLVRRAQWEPGYSPYRPGPATPR
jgi:malate dehydrogenase (oxaloacetate-decarboxylating)